MKKFLDENFLLSSKTSQQLYHELAKKMPIIDYHCHLPPDQIANDINFETLTQAWLYGDHYKWRAMRTNGVDENYITGNKSDWEKFQKWADTVPYTLRNPLFHWTHLELQRYFGITDLLDETSAPGIWDQANAALADLTAQSILRKFNVEVVCTTDDPTDDLQSHRAIATSALKT